MAELEREGFHLVREAKFLRLGPNRSDLIGADAGFNQLDRSVDPFSCFSVSVALSIARSADVEGAVVARPVAHEGLNDVEERLVTWAEQPIGEVVWMRVTALARNGVNRFDVV